MRRCVAVYSVAFILLMLCAQTIPAYEFAGKKFRIRNTDGPPEYFYNILCWSPGGEYAFCYGYNKKDNMTNRGEIYKVPANGGEAIKILDTEEGFGLEWPTENNIYYLSYNSDGNGLTFQIAIYDTTRGSYSEETRNGIRYRNRIPIVMNIDINTLETTVLVDPGEEPLWSPNGRYLLYRHFDIMSFSDNTQITNHGTPVIYDTVSSEKTFIKFPEAPDGSYNIYTVVFGPDTKFLYCVKNLNMEYKSDDLPQDNASPDSPYFGEYQIARKPIGGGKIEVMTDRLQGNASKLNFSPDGRWLLFNDNADVLILDTSNGNVYNALTGKPHTEARYTQYGTSVSSNSKGEIIEYKIDGEPVDPETDIIFEYKTPAFLPDGTKFTYIINGGGPLHSNTHIVDFDPSLYKKSDSDNSSSGDNSQPESFATLSNFPNPFNPVTTIEFTLSDGGNAKLEIYDITGRKVRELADGFFIAGSHTVRWDARDDTGNPVSSGVFISRLTTKHGTAHDRMTLVK